MPPPPRPAPRTDDDSHHRGCEVEDDVADLVAYGQLDGLAVLVQALQQAACRRATRKAAKKSVGGLREGCRGWPRNKHRAPSLLGSVHDARRHVQACPTPAGQRTGGPPPSSACCLPALAAPHSLLTAGGCGVEVAHILPQHALQVLPPHAVHLPHACMPHRAGFHAGAWAGRWGCRGCLPAAPWAGCLSSQPRLALPPPPHRLHSCGL